MSEVDRERPTGAVTAVTLDEVRQAIGDTDPHNTNAAAIRRVLGRGSLSTIQRHLDALRQEHRAAIEASEGDTAALEAPEAPREIMRGLWGAAYGLALSSVQSKLIAAQERVAELEERRRAQSLEIEALTELVDQVEEARDQARDEAQAARQAQAKAEAERDDALRLRDQIAALMSKIDALQPPQPPAS